MSCSKYVGNWRLYILHSEASNVLTIINYDVEYRNRRPLKLVTFKMVKEVVRIVQSQTNSTQHVFDDYTLQIIQVVLQLFCIKPKNWQIIVINIHFTLFASLEPYTLCLTDKFLCALFWHLRNMSIKLAKLYDLRLRINSSKLMCIGPSQTKILFLL